MMSSWGIFIILSLQIFTSVDAILNEPAPPLYPNVILAVYGQEYVNTFNKSVEFVYIYHETNFTDNARINIESNATSDEPLLIVIKQRKGILTWQIPWLVQRTDSDPQLYNKTSRTLCSSNFYKSNLNYKGIEDEYITVSISTGSKLPVFFNLTVELEHDFYLSLREYRNITIAPSMSRFYGYNFSDQLESGSVLIKIESNSATCMTMFVQNTTCPVFGLDKNSESTGYWQTVSHLGGITIPKETYPNGFFVVLVVKGDDIDCIGEMGNSNREKNISLIITENITKAEGIKAAAISLIIGAAFCSIYGISVIMHNACIRRKLRQQLLNEPDSPPPPPEQLLTPSVIEEHGPTQWASVEDDSSLDEDDIDMLDDILSDKDIIRTKKVLAVSDLARKEPKILRHKSRLYLYYLGTIAVFYALPVVQLVATYQNVLHMTGNQDLCYYNFLCSHPFFWFSDFNHVFSNFAYILLGLLFIFLTYVREQNDIQHEEKKKSYGIPQHYGLFYAMGTALMMEGVLSACYHVCPNHINFQFDTSFMYIISVLCMVKIYQTRHPDINARASVTFAVLALTIFLGF
ncbi:hypothetical protein PV328_000840 [Microctonus aethiopoides]|uniref:SID1 transmembrane family member 1-like n=1 Tax=Microctonus aethiopoides TaxID=144406 RepID=A0AA39FVY8_9HYME|nr:hypothetical protein PV328_000840 [Microctonus aethiopoides]